MNKKNDILYNVTQKICAMLKKLKNAWLTKLYWLIIAKYDHMQKIIDIY